MIFLEQLNALVDSGSLVDIRRDDLDVSDIRGVVLAVSPSLVLISLVNDLVSFDGFSVIRLEDVSFLRWGTGQMLAWERVLSTSPRQTVDFEFDLSNWSGAFELAQSYGGLITFHREQISPSTAYISDRFEWTDSLISASQITIEGEPDGQVVCRLDDLTRLEFGGAYERSLARMLSLP